MHAGSKIALLVLGVALLLMWWQGCELYAEADAAARDMWNCPVSSLIPVREPQMPYWSDDMGLHWYEVEVDDG